MCICIHIYIYIYINNNNDDNDNHSNKKKNITLPDSGLCTAVFRGESYSTGEYSIV